MTANDRFARLGIDTAPGQQTQHRTATPPVIDFSHGDVDAFPPAPGAIEAANDAYQAGSVRAYSPYRGHIDLLEQVAGRLAEFTGAPIDPAAELMITPGTQSGLFLAMSALIEPGDPVAIVEPDYFANRKIASYLRARILPVALRYEDPAGPATMDIERLEDAARAGAKVLVFANPNNPTGAIYSSTQIRSIVTIAEQYGMFVIIDQLYSRLVYSGQSYTQLRSAGIDPQRCVVLMGPSKTESLSGFRTGVAIGPAAVLDRMEQLLAIHSLRTAGYNQTVLHTWFAEPEGWLAKRILAHQIIRDELVGIFRTVAGIRVRLTEGGSYLFPRLPALDIPPRTFTELLRAEEGITVTPGMEFSPQHAASFRLNFSQDRARAAAAVNTIARLVKAHRMG